MPEIRLLIGPPGVGKTHYRSWFLTHNPGHVALGTDEILQEWADGGGKRVDEIINDAFSAADRLFYQRLDEALQAGRNIIIDRTNMLKIGRQRVLDMAAQAPYAYNRVLIVFDAPAALLEQRRRERALRGEKNVSAKTIRTMIGTYEPPESSEYDRIEFLRGERKPRPPSWRATGKLQQAVL